MCGRYTSAHTKNITLWNGGPSTSRPIYNGGNKETSANGKTMFENMQTIQAEFAKHTAAGNAAATALCDGQLIGDQSGYGAYQPWGDLYMDFTGFTANQAKVTDAGGVKTETTATTEGDTTAKVTLPTGTATAKVTVPVKAPTPGTVAVIVHANGTEEIVKTSVLTEDGVRFTAKGDANIKLVDNSKSFADMAESHWAADAVQFAASRELFNGTGTDTFSPTGDMTRGMLVTVLARLDGQETTGGALWYSKSTDWAKEQGLSDGTDPDGNITREQLAVMLYRYAGSPKLTETAAETAFRDTDSVSDWAADAMTWAVSAGILTGKSAVMLDPTGTATRAEVATMLQRFISR